ncbi:tyrosyl-DNA phosphodiesterase 2-like, partial [Tropilaelaps mercedesae]
MSDVEHKSDRLAEDESDVVVLSSDMESEAENAAGDSSAGADTSEAEEDAELPGDFPPVEVCAERCRRFAEVTDTNQALAQFYLQDREWNLERSIQDYYDDYAERNGGEPPSKKRATGPIPNGASGDVVELSSSDDESAGNSARGGAEPSDDLMKVISWNIDGLDPKNVDVRTNNICSIIKRAQADVAMLQEVVPRTLNLMKQNLESDYHILDSGLANYFTVILVHKKRMKLGESRVFDFASSSMGRKLQVVEVSALSSEIEKISLSIEKIERRAAD